MTEKKENKEEFVYQVLERQKHIALVAHDNKKEDLLRWVKHNKDILAKHYLCGTGTTAKILAMATDLPITPYKSGPLGGDLQIGSRIAEGEIDFMIFFWDPLEAQPHDPDVKALLRIGAVYNIPIATNEASADFMLSSPLMDSEYHRRVQDYGKKMAQRVANYRQEESLTEN